MKFVYDKRKIVLTLSVVALVGLAFAVAMVLGQSDPRSDPKRDEFLGTYDMNHDGWKGVLVLDRGGEFCRLYGTYTGTDGVVRPVEADAALNRSGQCSVTPLPTHRIKFSIKFDFGWQKFDGYMFTRDRRIIAGLTWWNNIPFGFYAVKRS